jgi:hypothetical protein
MKAISNQLLALIIGVAMFTSCQTGSVEHIAATKLVILQKVPVVDNMLDENFKASLELLYPHECHDTVFIQDQVFLERIDLKTPCRHEFAIAPSLLRDFFGSSNPDKKKALREELFYTGDTCFEKKLPRQFLADGEISKEDQPKIIGDYLSRNRKNALVYLVSSDTACRQYQIGGSAREVHSDFARLNCRIVEDLKRKTREELLNATVVLVLLPPETPDTTKSGSAESEEVKVEQKKVVAPVKHTESAPVSRDQNKQKKIKSATPRAERSATHPACPPDSVVKKLNLQYTAIVTEFRNLLHYIATTREDAELKRRYREEAISKIHQIPHVIMEGIPGNDLQAFLNSGFSRNVTVSPVMDRCKVIAGIRIGEK